MLSMFGIIKHELKKQNKLIVKYRDWKNTLYSWYDPNYAEYSKENIIQSEYEPGLSAKFQRCILFVNPKKEKFPVDLTQKEWELSCQVNANSADDQITVDAGRMYQDTYKWLIQSKSSPANYVFYQHFNHESGSSWSTIKNSGVKPIKGLQGLKLKYTPTSATTGTFYSWYSKNGTSWNSMGTFNWDSSKYPKFEYLDITVNNNSSVPISSIKFIYDNEILFG